MGCSPSKGKLFTKPEGLEPQNALPESPSSAAESPLDSVDSKPVEEVNQCLMTDEKDDETPLPTNEQPTEHKTSSRLSLETPAQNTEEIKEKEEAMVSQETTREAVQPDKIRKIEKRKKNKGKKRFTEKHRKSSIIQMKVDFPPHMVRAHQAAYAFLNPNISKYETLLGLLDQAAQTQLSLQPMMSALALCFEEINQALEEMAEEGELMLKEHGDCMALPSGMMGPAVMPLKPRTDTANSLDPPPDLLQQLLQNSTEKMRRVGGSVKELGDITLEEAVEYFSSFSKLLVERLQAKQAAERRLAHVLARVEGNAMRKSNPEDSALHSEDSGIGGESESLTGSERHRRHRGSAGSGSCGSGINIRGAFDSHPNNLPSLVGHNEDDEEDEEEYDDDDEEYEDDEGNRPGRKRSNSSPPDPSQSLRYMDANSKQDQQQTAKRPMTATRLEHVSSIRAANIMMELQRSQRQLDQRLKKMSEIQQSKALIGPHYNLYRAGLRRYSLNGQKGPLKTNQSPFCLPILAPQAPKRHSVKRLINTFSQGTDERTGHSLDHIQTHIRRPRKNGTFVLSEGGVVINGNNNNNGGPDGKDDLDVDNLPPPPPEVLMDNSFQRTDGENVEGSKEEWVQSLPPINQKTGVSQRLKSSVQNVDVLPNRASVKSKPIHPAKHDAVTGGRAAEQQPQTDMDPETEKANCRYQQARKIIHLRNAAESLDKRKTADLNGQGSSLAQRRMSQRRESCEFYEGEMLSCSPPITAPPVSRVRLPPSCPSVRQTYPSPPVFRAQPPSGPSSRPSSPRTVTRATDNTNEEIIPSVSFHDARSVFCRKESENSQTCIPPGSSVLPRPWGDVSRGRLPVKGNHNCTRRTQSEQRQSLTSHSEFSKEE